MEWQTFLNKALEYFNTPDDMVQLGFQFNGEVGPMSMLMDEEEWADAMVQLWDKIKAARTRPASMEIKNTVSQVAYNEERILTYLRTLVA